MKRKDWARSPPITPNIPELGISECIPLTEYFPFRARTLSWPVDPAELLRGITSANGFSSKIAGRPRGAGYGSRPLRALVFRERCAKCALTPRLSWTRQRGK